MSAILVADLPSMDGRHAAALEEQRHAMVVVGVYFDDSRMFDRVRMARNAGDAALRAVVERYLFLAQG